MTWPALSECYKTGDFSWYNHQGWPLYRPLDVDAWMTSHPDVEVAIVRFNWPDGSPDKHYPYIFDGFKANGVKLMGYGWSRKGVAAQQIMKEWSMAMGERVPLVLWTDYEDSRDNNYVMPPGELLDFMWRHHEGVSATWPNRIHGNYSRAGWLEKMRLTKHDILDGMLWWLAHWPYPPPDFQDEARSFAELDAMLPISNSFTPYKGNIVRLPEENVVGWQGTSKLNGHGDAGYFLRSFIDPIFGVESPPTTPEPEPKPVPLQLIYPAGAIRLEVVED